MMQDNKQKIKQTKEGSSKIVNEIAKRLEKAKKEFVFRMSIIQ